MIQPTAAHPCHELREWGTIVLPSDVVLTAEDHRLRELLGADGRLIVEELRSGLRLTARSWVGVVRFSTFEVHVRPKLAGENVGLVKLIDFASGLDCLRHYPALRTLDGGEDSSLLDLLALLLAEATEKIVRSGLLADYEEVEDDLPVVRGRLLLRKQALKRFGRIDRLECRYDEHTTDTVENKLLLAALSACATVISHPRASLRIRRLLGLLHEACSLDDFMLDATRHSMTYDRLNEHYREAHTLAWLVLDGLGVHDLFSGRRRCFAFMLDMNKLFEAFVTRWLGSFLRGQDYRVLPQRRDRTILWHADENRAYTQVIPDVLLERRDRPGRCLPVDAKYKCYDDRSFSTSDIFQSFVYAFAYGEQHAVLPTALVIYPAESASGSRLRLHVRRTSGVSTAELIGIGVHIPTALEDAVRRTAGVATQAVLKLVEAALAKPIPAGP